MWWERWRRTQTEDPTLKKVEGFERFARLFIYLGGAVFLMSLLLFLIKTDHPIDPSQPIRPDIFAAFGNLVSGSVGVFWSLAGIIFFYGALRLQREDLQRQREEFKKSIEIERESQKIAKEQALVLQLQKFESTFFALLNQHNHIVNSLLVKRAGIGGAVREIRARECFKYLYDEQVGQDAQLWQGTMADRQRTPMKITDALMYYEQRYEKEEFWIGHYFRNLYNVIKYVDRSTLQDYEKKVYTNIVRAQLFLADELLLLFYNCLSKYGKKFYPLVQRYALLKTIPENKLMNKGHMEEYSPSAFAKVQGNEHKAP